MKETVRELEEMPTVDLEDLRLSIEDRMAADTVLLKRVQLALELKKKKTEKEDMFGWIKENLVDHGTLSMRDYIRFMKRFASTR